MKFNKLIFIHIPRTSGTYIEKELCKKYDCKIKWPDPNTDNLFGLKKVNDNNFLTLQHLTLTEIIKYNFIKKDTKYKIFTVIRHPYERVISLYKNWFKKYKTLDLFLNKLESLDLNNYCHTGITTLRKNFNYKNMTTYLEEIKYFVLPQYYYITNNEDYNVDIVKYTDIEKLNNIFGLNLKFIKGKSDRKLTVEQKNRIYNIYKIDFDEFNFEK